jgi:acetyltransferase-like isoleucine patch superfamily enzyme
MQATLKSITRAGLATAALLAGVVSVAFGQVAQPNLIAHYKLDEGMGTTTVSEVNSPAADGIFLAPPYYDPTWETTNLAPIPNNVAALNLDSNDAVMLDPSVVQPISGSFAIAAWINVAAFTNDCMGADFFFLAGRVTPPWHPHITLGLIEANHPNNPPRTVYLGLRDDADNVLYVYDSTPAVLGQWIHYAATFDATTGVGRLYRDGVKVASGTLSVPFAGFTFPPPDAKAQIGGVILCGGNSYASLVGLVDDLAIWNTVLTAQQINNVMNFGVSGGGDPDGDGIVDAIDNCPTVFNPFQEQTGNNVGGPYGDACVDPTASVPPDAFGANPTVGEGADVDWGSTFGDNAVLEDFADVDTNVTAGDNVIVGYGAEIKQGAMIGSYVDIGPGVVIGSGVIIGDHVMIGVACPGHPLCTVIGRAGDIGDLTIIGTDVDVGKSVTIGENVTVLDGAIVPKLTVIPDGATFP